MIGMRCDRVELGFDSAGRTDRQLANMNKQGEENRKHGIEIFR